MGNCTLEESKPRAPKSHPLSEYIGVYQFVNTIEDQGKSLSKEQRRKSRAVSASS